MTASPEEILGIMASLDRKDQLAIVEELKKLTLKFTSRTVRTYVDSTSEFTKTKMREMTAEQVAFADRVYAWAEKNYEKGGDTIVETMEPWEVVKEFKSVKSARGFARMRHDHEEDIRNA